MWNWNNTLILKFLYCLRNISTARCFSGDIILECFSCRQLSICAWPRFTYFIACSREWRRQKSFSGSDVTKGRLLYFSEIKSPLIYLPKKNSKKHSSFNADLPWMACGFVCIEYATWAFQKPALPRYSETWDPQIVLLHLKTFRAIIWWYVTETCSLPWNWSCLWPYCLHREFRHYSLCVWKEWVPYLESMFFTPLLF